jgi:outer membrane receptor protein involved in Fe transport
MLPMSRKVLIGSLTAVALVAGGAGAVAATRQDEAKQRESRVLGDAAKRLNVTPEELSAALRGAQDDELDRAVQAGTLTQEQADAIKARRSASGLVLGGPGGPRGRGHRGGPFGRGALAPRMLAPALGLTPAQLRERFADGQTVAEIAKAQGKDLADVRKAVRDAVVSRLDAAVKAGRLTDAQRDEAVERLDDHLQDLGDFGGRPPRGPFGGRDGDGPHGGPGGPPPFGP